MSKPQSLRNIPPEALRYAAQISARTGLSMSDVFRLALLSGCLVELTRMAPDADGNYGEVTAQALASALRRSLASAIDFLLEHGQHPSQGLFPRELTQTSSLPVPSSQVMVEQREGAASAFDQALGDDLELLGMGFGLAETTDT